MTLDEFLAALRETPREWYLTPGARMIRLPATDSATGTPTFCCPVTACDPMGPRSLGVFRDSGYRVGLPAEVVTRIAASADNEIGSESYDPTLRAQLLDACGLKESGT